MNGECIADGMDAVPADSNPNSTTSLAFLNLGNDLQVLIRHTFTAFVRLFMSVQLGLLFEPLSMHQRLSVIGSSSHLVRKGPSSAGFILEWEYGDDRVRIPSDGLREGVSTKR